MHTQSPSCYASRRQALMQAMGPDAFAIVFSGHQHYRNGDTHYPFRPSSDFFYLTGLAEPDALLILAPGRAEGASLLLKHVPSPEMSVWDNTYVSHEQACAISGVDQSLDREAFERQILELMFRYRSLYSSWSDREGQGRLSPLLQQAVGQQHRRRHAPEHWNNLDPILHRMRRIKGPEELSQIRRAIEATAEGHKNIFQKVSPGIEEHALEAVFLEAAYRLGSSGMAYPPIVASGSNACILHYHGGREVLKPDDWLLVDAGAEYGFYASDVTRCCPVNGRWEGGGAEVYACVLAAQKACIEAIRPGVTFEDIQLIAERHLTQSLIDLGVLKLDFEEALETRAFRPYYMHSIGHWMGLDVHDPCPYQNEAHSAPIAFEPGMVLTVEPGLYFSPSESTPSCFHGIGIRIEDDILVTEQGFEVLTQAIPKEPSELLGVLQRGT